MIKIPNYKIIKQIYEGNNSIVYQGIRQQDQQSVILKILRQDYPSSEVLACYRQEYEIVQYLRNIPGVINVYNIEQYQNKLLICLEDFNSISLKNLDISSFKLAEILAIAIQAAEILGQIHHENIIHKDVNPANFIWNSNQKSLKIIDFGIATQLSRQYLSLKNPDILEGTISYLSPEQTGRMNRDLDYRTDFYSLGAMFYELFTGKLPFDSQDAMELVHCHIAKQPIPPKQINPKLPQAISDIILKLLEKTAEARYQSAWGIKADLEKVLENLSTSQDSVNLQFKLAQQDASNRFQISQKLYGREYEINTLLTALKRVASGTTEIMLVTGYSGIGKSILVKEIYRSLTKTQGYFITGKFGQLQRNIPYSAIVNAFKELIQQLLTENAEKNLIWQEKLLASLEPNGQIIIDVIPDIELIIGKQPNVPQLGSMESQNRFNLVFQNFIQVFCQYPLVIFLDDLQWADLATLSLLENIMSSKKINNLFIIGAYRDNEVKSSHSLIVTLENLRKENVVINQITLKPLAIEHVNQLIADSLHQNLPTVSLLANLVMQKTGGNPFFISQFLYTLYEENLLNFIPPINKQKGYWQWDIEQIKTLNITDNVVELMIAKLKKLPTATQHVLRLSACIGSDFDLETLSIIYEKSVIDTFQALQPVLIERLIFPTSSYKLHSDEICSSQLTINNFRFSHDRVQQAAYTLIDEEQKKTVHLQIGRLLLKNTTNDKLEEKIFTIVGHFNQSIELITEEKLRLAELNLIAGRKAKLAMAYEAATIYLNVGKECLPNRSWEIEYDLTLNLHIEAAEAAYLSGNFKQMEELVKLVSQHAKTLSDEVRVCEILMSAYVAQNQRQEAIKTALIFVDRLGINFPKESTKEDVKLALQEMQKLLVGKSIQSLIDLPIMTNPDKVLAMRVIGIVIPAAYFVSPSLMTLMVLKQVELSFEYGNVAESSFAYVCYGFILCGIVIDIESGYKFGQLALDLLERLGENRLKARVVFLFNNLIKLWKWHVKDTLQPLLGNYQISLETGVLEFAAYSIQTYSYFSYFIGKQLNTLEQEMAKYNNAATQLKQEGAFNRHYLYWQVVLNLTGHCNHPCLLTGKVYDEKIYLKRYQQANDKTGLHNLHLNKCILHYLFQEYTAAIENAEIAEQHLDGVTSSLPVAIFHFYDSLIRLASYPDLTELEQVAILKKVAINQEKMAKWAKHSSTNFLHKFYLVEAERCHILGEDGDAREHYDQAIKHAEKNGYINDAALAYELAGKFYLQKNKIKLAQLYLHDAHYSYQQWGAVAKAENLETKYSQFFTSKPVTVNISETTLATMISSTISSTSTASGWLDLNSVVKASQTLSGEIILGHLLEKMMHIVIENAGAEKGFLLLPKQNEWFIEAEGNIDNVTVLQSSSINNISANIVNYVIRTKEPLVLHNASQEGNFTNDSYIIEHNPQSILCIPLLNQKKLIGILYLENNLATEVFTVNRVEILNLLSSQIAISIENSLLYDNLEQKVEERTYELKIAKETAEEANKAIMESIEYAEIIQSSLLPNMQQVKTYMPNSFFLWMPRDVVGGDMLYAEQVENGFIVAVIDCTGHGVPGAFMTMIVSTNLRRIIREQSSHSPANILKQLNFLVKTSLQQDTEYAKSDDGLDIAICLVIKDTLTFAGARLPLYYIHNDQVTMIKGDKQSLGYKRSDVNFAFTNHTIKIEAGMSCYLSTDGFTDQLGGHKRLLLGKKRFKQLLLNNYQRPFAEQSEIILQAFNDYKNNNDRQDDVTVVGFGAEL